MKTYLECIPCFFRQALEVAKLAGVDEIKQKEIVNNISQLVPRLCLEMSPPEIAREIYKIIYRVIGHKDPFYDIKKKSNRKILELYPQMKDRVDIDRLCKTFIKRKHQCFHYIPDQQLGTAFFVWSYIHYKQELLQYRYTLAQGNGPGTAMRKLANEDEENIGGQSEASKLYSFLLDEWFSQYQPEITKKMDEHCRRYERVYYMPLLMQDLYKRAYDGDGYFDGRTYGDDEW